MEGDFNFQLVQVQIDDKISTRLGGPPTQSPSSSPVISYHEERQGKAGSFYELFSLSPSMLETSEEEEKEKETIKS